MRFVLDFTLAKTNWEENYVNIGPIYMLSNPSRTKVLFFLVVTDAYVIGINNLNVYRKSNLDKIEILFAR